MGYLYQLMEQSYFLFNERNVTELFFFVIVIDNRNMGERRWWWWYKYTYEETRVYGEEKSIFHLFLFLVLCGCGQIMEDKAKCTMWTKPHSGTISVWDPSLCHSFSLTTPPFSLFLPLLLNGNIIIEDSTSWNENPWVGNSRLIIEGQAIFLLSKH